MIGGALDELKTLLGDAVTLIMETIDHHNQRFFVQALQLAPPHLAYGSQVIQSLEQYFRRKCTPKR